MLSDLLLATVTPLTFRRLKMLSDCFITEEEKKFKLSLKYLCSCLDNYLLNYRGIIFHLKSLFV